MKKIILIGFLLLFCTINFAQEFRPSTVKSMDVTITSEINGSFSGAINQGDTLELFFLSIQEGYGQDIYYTNEFMEIGGKKFTPTKVTKNELDYASYKINDLYKYAKTPIFKIVRETKIKKTAEIGLEEDYDLSEKIINFDRFLEETEYIEVNDSELQSKAMIEFNSNSEIETISEITKWVNTNIQYDFENYYNGVYSAKQTYNSGAGVCDEFANLTAAFMRIKGIPARYVTGISYDGERFGLHGWVEVYLPNTGWIGVDSTYGEAGYVDAAHFAIAKTFDANKAIDFSAKTKSKKKITIQSEPSLDVELNSIDFFKNLINAEIIKPKQVQTGETFEITTKLTNTSEKNAIFPIELILHENFKSNANEKLIYFKKNETITITWEINAPEEKFENGYYDYGFLLLLPDGNISDTIKVIPEKEYVQNKSNIQIKDISPFISNKTLEIKIILENLGDKKGETEIEIFFEENQVDGKKIELDAFEEKKLSFLIKNIKEGKVTVNIIGDETRKIEFTIPKKETEKIISKEIPLENAQKQENNEEILIIGSISISIVFLIALIGLVLLRK